MATKTKFGLKGKDRDSYLELILAFPLSSIRSDEHLDEAQILDTNLESRRRAVSYFSESYSSDLSLMPLAIQAVEIFGSTSKSSAGKRAPRGCAWQAGVGTLIGADRR